MCQCLQVAPIEIAHAARADIPRLLEIRHAAFSAHVPAFYSEQEVQTLLDDVDESELAEMIDASQLFVARIEGAIVGLAGWKDDRIRHVYVAPGYERQGIGTQVLARAEDDFRNRTNADEVKAGVGLQAELFYVANGYELSRRLKDWDGSDYLEMTKKL